MTTKNATLLEELEALKASIQSMIDRVKGGDQVETQDDEDSSGTNPPGNPPVKPPGGN